MGAHSERKLLIGAPNIEACAKMIGVLELDVSHPFKLDTDDVALHATEDGSLALYLRVVGTPSDELFDRRRRQLATLLTALGCELLENASINILTESDRN